MARCLLCLLLLAIQAAAGSLETGFAVRFMVREDNIEVHVRDRTVSYCRHDTLKQEYTSMQLYKNDILVVSVDTDSRACLVNSTAFSEPFNLEDDTKFAQLALEGWPVNVTTLFNISVACSGSPLNQTVQVMISNALQLPVSACCAGTDPSYDWCHRCGKGQYREGVRCHPCPRRKTTPRKGVFTKDDCICPEGYENTTDECPKCDEGTHSVIQDGQNMGCQSCNTAQL